MYNTYSIETNLTNKLSGENGIKVLHAVLTNTFEKCINLWKKGDQYPSFKICKIMDNKIIISTDREMNALSFNFTHGHNLNTTVFIKKIDNIPPYNFKNNQKVIAFGRLSMYKNYQNENKRKKIALVRNCYKNKLLDENNFTSIIKEKTGIDPIDIAVEPVYIDKDAVPNNKRINSAFDISIIGIVTDQNITNSLNYTSVGQDTGYGFGSLDIRDL